MKPYGETVLKAAKLTRIVALSIGMFAIACGGGTKQDTTPDPDPEPTGPQGQDIIHEYKGADYEGMTFTPEALENPGVPGIKVKGKPRLKRLRKKIAKQQKAGKLGINDVHTLVNLLVDEAIKQAKAGDVAAAAEARTEARDILAALAAQQADKTQEITLKRHAALQWSLDETAAVGDYTNLLAKFPASTSKQDYQTYIAYGQLRAGDTAAATTTIDGWTVGTTNGASAYVLAWVSFRNRDWDTARDAIVSAATTWKGGGKKGLLRDAKLILSRAGAPVETARQTLQAILPAAKPQLLTIHTYELNQGYLFAGNYQAAADTLDTIFDGATEGDKVTFRYNQADYLFRVNDPLGAAEKAKAAYDLCAAWAKCTPELKAAVTDRILLLAKVYHNTFATSLDPKYSQASKILYSVYLGVTPAPANKAEVADMLANLEQHISGASPENGKHAKDAMKTIITARAEAVQACYEGVLQGEPALAGTIKLTIDVQPDGSVSAVASDPAAGKEGLAAVAGCLSEAIKGWSFPARTVPGLTRLIYPANFKPKAAPAPTAKTTPSTNP